MKKIIIAAIVGTLIFFVYQSVMWVGGFHNDLWIYAPGQDSALSQMTHQNFKEGLYFIPSADPSSKTFNKDMEQTMKNRVGKPWAMVFYHAAMKDTEASGVIAGFTYSLVAVLIAVLVIYHGRFSSFQSRFLVGMAFGIFTILQGVLDNMNWWSYPWSFIKPQVMDLTIGWACCSIWLAYYLKNKASTAA